jgi:hypothetical protein
VERGGELGAGVLLKLRGSAVGAEDGPPMVTERVGAALRGVVRKVSAGLDCCDGGDVTGVLMLRVRAPGISVAVLRGAGAIVGVRVLMLCSGGEML